MGHGNEPADSAGAIAVPPELREGIDEAIAAGERFAATGDPATLDRAVHAWETITRHEVFGPAPPVFRAAVFNTWAHALEQRYAIEAVPSDLDAAIAAFEQAIEIAPAASPSRSGYLSNLGSGLRTRYGRTGIPADLDEAIVAFREVVEATPADAPGRPGRLTDLGNGLLERYAHSGAPADLDAAMMAFEEAVETTPADSPDRPIYLTNLGNGLSDRFAHGGDEADLEAAIAAYRQGLDATQAGAPGRPGRLSNLGTGLLERYYRRGALADLEAAINAFEEAVDTAPADAPGRSMYLTNLGAGLRDRYTLTGAQADLEAEITAFEAAVETSEDDDPGRPGRLNNLAGGLSDRYVRTGLLADLDAVLATYHEAVETSQADAPGRPGRLNNLGTGLLERYYRRGALADLDGAIAAFQEALEAIPPDSPERPTILANVGSGLRDRYDAKAEPADLEAAIKAFREALAATPADTPGRPARLDSLGNGLRARYRRAGKPADLEAAIKALREATEATPTDAPDRPGRVANLGYGLRERYDRTNDVADLEAAVDAFREACRSGLSVAPAITLTTAQAWGGWAGEREAWAEATEAYGDGLAAIDGLYRTQLLPGAKQTWLQDAQGLAAAAAYALARTGDFASAFLALERGRARLLTEAIRRDRADLSEIEALDPAAYAAYEQAAGQLRALESAERAAGTGRPGASPSVPAAVQDQARQARAELQAAIGRLQQLPGHAGFGRQASIEEVAAAAEPGCPVVALITTAAGSVGLLVSRMDDPAVPTFEAIWAPELTTTVLNGLLTTVRDGQVTGGYLAGQLGDQDALSTALADGLPVVGTSLIGPLAARLRELKAAGVVLLPTGLLGLLPLHAAPYVVDGETRCLLDEFDVSHTPGALVLRAARAALAARDAQPAVLVGVGNPQPHPQPLAFARAELEEVARFFPDGASHPLYETAATETAFVGLLPQATHVHLACHGRFDADTPLDSCLELARPDPPEPGGDEGRVRLEEILAGDWFGHTRLVVLSACQTAITDARRLPDEAIGLPAGLLQAGVPGVIGTLWSVDDLSTTLLMTQFYAYHRQGDPTTGEGPLPPAAALRRAQAWLKTRTADELVTLLAAHRSMAAAAEGRRGTRMSTAEASVGVRQLGLEDPASRPFADPFYWAPFVAIGA